ncbi:MAG: MaoC family dehydratase [Candidatus Korobacteraceae bacterium]
MASTIEKYLEDFQVGQRYSSGSFVVRADDIKRFAAEFDPQPFHLDDEIASTSLFRGLAASGWHTAAITMRLFVQSDFKPVGGLVGVNFEGRWPRPLRPNDEVHLEVEVLELRRSKSNPARGLVTVRATTLNQENEPVQIATFIVTVPSRLESIRNSPV